MRDRLIPVLLGAAVMVGVYLTMGWWLNRSAPVGVTILLVGIVATIVGPSPRTLGWLLTSLVVTMVALLFIDGPGTIFPIVLAIGTFILGTGVLAGWVIRSVAQMVTAKLLRQQGG